MSRARHQIRTEQGQAAVEMVAALPLIAVVGALLLQALVGAHAWFAISQSSGRAARELAMAFARGEPGVDAARAASLRGLPQAMRSQAVVQIRGSRVTISHRMPAIGIFRPIARRLPALKSSAEFAQ